MSIKLNLIAVEFPLTFTIEQIQEYTERNNHITYNPRLHYVAENY